MASLELGVYALAKKKNRNSCHPWNKISLILQFETIYDFWANEISKNMLLKQSADEWKYMALAWRVTGGGGALLIRKWLTTSKPLYS